jgi:hypothetical protein
VRQVKHLLHHMFHTLKLFDDLEQMYTQGAS